MLLPVATSQSLMVESFEAETTHSSSGTKPTSSTSSSCPLSSVPRAYVCVFHIRNVLSLDPDTRKWSAAEGQTCHYPLVTIERAKRRSVIHIPDANNVSAA